MSSIILCDQCRLGMANGTGQGATTANWTNWASSGGSGNVVLQAILETATGDAITDANKRAVTLENTATNGPSANEVSGTGYTARGMAPGGQSVTQTSSLVTVTCSNPSWSASTITASGVWFVNHQSTAGTSPALAYFPFGSSIVSTAGTFLVTINGSGLFTIGGG